MRSNIYIVFVSFLCLMFTSDMYCQTNDTTIYEYPSACPEFRYKDYSDTNKSIEMFFKLNYIMSAVLLDNGYCGRINMQFIVEKNGQLSNIKVIRGIDESIDNSIVKQINKMPPWIPAKVNNKAVRCRFTTPIYINWLYGNND